LSAVSKKLTDEDFKKRLTPEQYKVLREKGTEAPFSGKFLDNKEPGVYTCGACGAELFMSNHKFDSGSGWPSFYDVAKSGAVNLTDDDSLGMHRVEATCANCGSHLGHVFDDGPTALPDGRQATGQRFCINSASLEFLKQKTRE
jgi:peptide-methionine (R)-S-oxide reductase